MLSIDTGPEPDKEAHMEKTVHYLETGSRDPRYNLAFEEFVLTHRTEGEYLMLWQNENTVVVGQNQNAEEEIDRAFVEAHGITVVRRTTGGGAVYHDLGNLNYSFITDSGDAEQITMTRFTQPVVAALQGLGLQAEAAGRNDILVEGKKVSGTAQRLVGNRILYHGTMLFDSDPSMVAGALRADPAKFQSKSSKSVRSRIGNIRSFLPKDMTLPAFWEYLKQALAQGGELQEEHLTPEELEEVQRLRDEKYATWEWTYGRSPKYTMTNRRKWDGGILEPRIAVEEGRITQAVFFGDFLSLTSLEPLTEALKGCPFRQEEVGKVLSRFPLEQYFGSITQEEILETIFHVSE